MKLFRKFLLLCVLAVMLISSGTGTVSADLLEDDDLMNGVVKDSANRFCFSVGTASIETTDSTIQTTDSTIQSTDSTIQSTAFSSITRTSKSGSKIFLPVEAGNTRYGYCHLYMYHMHASNGKHGQKDSNSKSQFENARYPSTTMDVIMEVINKDKSLSNSTTIPGRASKTAYSSIEGQQVTVSIHLASGWTGKDYGDKDWIVVSAYPSGY